LLGGLFNNNIGHPPPPPGGGGLFQDLVVAKLVFGFCVNNLTGLFMK